jgi:hypothetical protein
MQQQQYKVNNKIFDSIESAGEYMLTLKHSATMEVYTPPSAESVKLSVVRNILIREMLEWAGNFVHNMTPSTDVCWMYSVEDANGFSDAGDTWYEDLEDVTYGNNLMWEDAKEDYEGAVSNFECLFGNYNSFDSVEKLSEMLNTMYHTMSDHSSETDDYIGCVRDSIEKLCTNNPNIAHSYDHPRRRTTISFSGNVDAMYDAYMLERNS